jgi:hypothetical protein
MHISKKLTFLENLLYCRLIKSFNKNCPLGLDTYCNFISVHYSVKPATKLFVDLSTRRSIEPSPKYYKKIKIKNFGPAKKSAVAIGNKFFRGY